MTVVKITSSTATVKTIDRIVTTAINTAIVVLTDTMVSTAKTTANHHAVMNVICALCKATFTPR